MHLLVIEDNPDLVANLYDFFEPLGHAVDAAYDFRTGLRFALDKSYDAIVLDLNLSGRDGLDLCEQLRNAGNATPVLMLTARDTLDDKLAGFAHGADDYLVKPFALPELEARLAALVRRSRGETGQGVLRIADLELDPSSLEVRRAGQEIALPPIPMRILEFLMRQSPRVVPRLEIERRIWGNDRPDSDALKAHVHILRSAIDKPFGVPLLRTVQRIGYQIAAPSGDSRADG